MGLIGGAATNVLSEDEFNQAGWNTELAKGAINNVWTPKMQDMKVKLSGLVQQGILTPEMADTMLQEATAYEQMDPLARNELVETVQSEGFDPQSKAALYQLQQQTGEQERGSREAILQDAAARGISGSGIELASQMGNQQGNATRLANQGFQAAADANARHMQAVQGLATMDSQKAAAQDAINQFNAANRQSVENMNVNAGNAAQAQNLAEKQRIADSNVATKNQQQLYNAGLHQLDFENRLAKGQSYANAATGAASNEQDTAAKKSAAASKFSDKNLKTDVVDIDPSEMLDNLTGYSYEYKEGSGMEDGPQVGVMAQDLEKSAPQAVTDTPEGKTIDYSKMGGPMLAALSALKEKLDELESRVEDRSDA